MNKNQTAKENMTMKKAEALELLAKLTEAAQAYAEGEEIHWGHVGSFGAALEYLQQAGHFLHVEGCVED